MNPPPSLVARKNFRILVYLISNLVGLLSVGFIVVGFIVSVLKYEKIKKVRYAACKIPNLLDKMVFLIYQQHANELFFETIKTFIY